VTKKDDSLLWASVVVMPLEDEEEECSLRQEKATALAQKNQWQLLPRAPSNEIERPQPEPHVEPHLQPRLAQGR
jgi:hypothetical protein